MSQNSELRKEYIHRLNRVIDFIENNLSKELRLQELADVACFSPFHFHKIFSSLMNETLNQFILRVRLQKAATDLTLLISKSITDIALNCGFSSSATFARSFKEKYKMSATEWRNQKQSPNRKNCKTENKIEQADSKPRKAYKITSSYIMDDTYTQHWRIEMKDDSKLTAEVKIKEMESFQVAYVRHIGPYQNDPELFGRLFNKLFSWAGPRGLLKKESRVLSMYHDNPDITESDKLRTSICIEVPADTEVSGEVGKMEIPRGKYAVAHFEINSDQFADAWGSIYGGWLPESGYQPDDRPTFELCLNNPEEHPEHKHLVDIYVPVKPL